MNSEAPLYKVVYDRIVNRVISGELGPGAMLPSEKDLGVEFGVSQGTARKALSQLESNGIVLRRQGLGTFVTTTTPETALFHFFRLRRRDGSQVVPEKSSETVIRRPVTQQEKYILTECGDEVYEIRRIRTVDGVSVIFERIILPQILFPGLEDRGNLPNTLYAMFQRSYGIAIVRANEKLRAVSPTKKETAALDLGYGAVLLEVQREAIDLSDRVVELRFSRYVTDDFHYEVSLK